MIYWFTGQPGAGKTVLGSKLHSFLRTEKRNWRKDVFHLDGDDLPEFVHKNECDVVVSLVAPYRWLREEFKERIGYENFQEIFVHTTEKRERDHFHVKEYEAPEVEFIDVDTTKDNPDKSFSKIINHLTKLKKL